MLMWLVLGVAAVCARRHVDTSPHRDVVTTQGTVRGYLSPDGYAYLGVPYARPPTRDRFKAPDPPPRWDGIFEATHRVSCHHATTGANCLVVNVFTPEHGTSLPVLVYIHAGGFQTGRGPHYPPSRILHKGIVVVTLNYRLGVRGFLCLGLPQASGNAGLKDQVAALYWIQRNIANFGGNPHDVTVYGTEAGAASIQILLVSDITEGLFQKVIMESGSVLSPSTLTYNPISKALDAARKFGYEDNEDRVKLLKFYQKISEKELSSLTEIFLPCVENGSYYSNTLLEDDPKSLIMQGKFRQVPMLITYTNSDDSINVDTFNTFPDNFDQLLPNNLNFESNKIRHRVAELVKEFYFENNNQNLVQKFLKYSNDLFIGYPVVKSALLHGLKNTHPVFLMRLDNNHGGRENTSKHFQNIFDYIYNKNNNKLEKERIANMLLKLWTNFIKLGDPTPLTTELIPVIWQPVVPGEPGHRLDLATIRELVVGKTIAMTEPASSQYLAFWDHVYKKFYKFYKDYD
nr:esterase [Manduca sexta]